MAKGVVTLSEILIDLFLAPLVLFQNCLSL